MSPEQDLWEFEESFWLGGVETFRSRMASGAIMVFPYPAGILQGESIAEGLQMAPRWRSVEMTDRVVSREGNTALLAYRASAEREGQPLYEALCASTYLYDGDNWRLMSHQHTPV